MEIWAAGLSWAGRGVSCSRLWGLLGWGEFWSGSCAGSEGLGPVVYEDALAITGVALGPACSAGGHHPKGSASREAAHHSP